MFIFSTLNIFTIYFSRVAISISSYAIPAIMFRFSFLLPFYEQSMKINSLVAVVEISNDSFSTPISVVTNAISAVIARTRLSELNHSLYKLTKSEIEFTLQDCIKCSACYCSG